MSTLYTYVVLINPSSWVISWVTSWLTSWHISWLISWLFHDLFHDLILSYTTYTVFHEWFHEFYFVSYFKSYFISYFVGYFLSYFMSWFVSYFISYFVSIRALFTALVIFASRNVATKQYIKAIAAASAAVCCIHHINDIYWYKPTLWEFYICQELLVDGLVTITISTRSAQANSQYFWGFFWGGGANFGWSFCLNVSKQKQRSLSGLFPLVKYNI